VPSADRYASQRGIQVCRGNPIGTDYRATTIAAGGSGLVTARLRAALGTDRIDVGDVAIASATFVRGVMPSLAR
jgi:hypothetical protein